MFTCGSNDDGDEGGSDICHVEGGVGLLPKEGGWVEGDYQF